MYADFNRALTFAQELIRIPSVSGAEGEVALRTVQELKRLRFDDVWIDAVGNVVGRVRGRRGGPTVMLGAHLDTVDVGDSGTWEHPPYAAEVRDGFLHGRGAMDIKGPLALLTYAAAQFVSARPDGDVYVGFTVLEERGAMGMDYLMTQGELCPDVVILGEATNGDICIGHRGRLELVVEVRGVAAHASAPHRARNPLHLLPEVITAVGEFAGNLSSDPILGPSTLSITDVDATPKTRNVIPGVARVVLDWRVLPGQTIEAALDLLRAFLRERVPPREGFTLTVEHSRERLRTYTNFECDYPVFTPAFLVESMHPAVGIAVQTVKEVTQRTPAVRPWTFSTDGGFTCGTHGVVTLGYAPGEERFAHTDRERLEVSGARTAYGVYPRLVRALQAGVAPTRPALAAPALACVEAV
ncbi:MAG TPA: M20/M25/M40 family metallo-hydrolase [Longimicrobium sp.]|jgi:putative selenium metabolism hydrolase